MIFHLVNILLLNFINFIVKLIKAHIFSFLLSQMQPTHRPLNCQILSTLVQDNPKLPYDGGEIPKSQRKDWRFDSWP